MQEQRIIDSERLERTFDRLLEKACMSGRPDEPLLGPPGYVCREFADDLRQLPDDLWMRVEEHALMLEDAVRKGKLCIDGPRSANSGVVS